MTLAVNIDPVPLEPGRSYEWRIYIDGDSKDDWRVVFTTRSAPLGPFAGP